MNNRAQTLLREVLDLAPHERADVAAELLASLDEPPTEDPVAVQTAWAKEIERRTRRVRAGESAGEPWEEVRERIACRLIMKSRIKNGESLNSISTAIWFKSREANSQN